MAQVTKVIENRVFDYRGDLSWREILQPHRNDRVLWINLLTLHLHPDLLLGPSPQSSLLLTRPALKSVCQTRSLVGDKCWGIRMASRSGQCERIHSIRQSRKKWLKSGRISKTIIAPPHLERSPFVSTLILSVLREISSMLSTRKSAGATWCDPWINT